MRTEDFNYALPEELIAQEPAPCRDASRLLVVERATGRLHHQVFRDLPGWLRPGDVLVLNDSKVIPARLQARTPRGAQVELLLLEEAAPNEWWVMAGPGRKAPVGAVLQLLDRRQQATGISVEITQINPAGHRRARFGGVASLWNHLEELGEPPLPPYIQRPGGHARPEDFTRYQTVYAGPAGSVAAPTAGLHFTPAMLAQLEAQGVKLARVTLHVGVGTFAPVKAARVEDHVMHEERYAVSAEAAAVIEKARAAGGRVVAVGTTSLRVLETVAREHGGHIVSHSGRTRLFVYPPCEFRVVEVLLTNFHLPQSTLLMLVSAFAAPGRLEGRELILRAYREAVERRYRFFSYGDAMLLV
ncbi:tRNA preQ1(34) S-adenosylmethionine ribosyltransferase-isomerase QueA [Fontisphaera persica]|nr:tRNA preQ1(34) S-adenosylmethionine ribosyltransferase-isomerase QueA [Fontisphaera persica]WCJ61235.1 tRNA preQ1(34) S-adenosylmethionine ribosyltransferase-isomerase QueA [Fontisphaera persica]